MANRTKEMLAGVRARRAQEDEALREYLDARSRRDAVAAKRDAVIAREDAKVAAADAVVDKAIIKVVDVAGSAERAAFMLDVSLGTVRRAAAARNAKPTPKPAPGAQS